MTIKIIHEDGIKIEYTHVNKCDIQKNLIHIILSDGEEIFESTKKIREIFVFHKDE